MDLLLIDNYGDGARAKQEKQFEMTFLFVTRFCEIYINKI